MAIPTEVMKNFTCRLAESNYFGRYGQWTEAKVRGCFAVVDVHRGAILFDATHSEVREFLVPEELAAQYANVHRARIQADIEFARRCEGFDGSVPVQRLTPEVLQRKRDRSPSSGMAF